MYSWCHARSTPTEWSHCLDVHRFVADERALDCLDDPTGVAIAASQFDAPDGFGAERDPERVVDGVEDVGDLVVVGDEEDAGDDSDVGADALCEAGEFARSSPAIGLQRVTPRAERVGWFALARVDAQVGEGVAEVGGRGVVAYRNPAAWAVDRRRTDERDGRAGVGDGATTDVALDWGKPPPPGGLAGAVVPLGRSVAASERDQSVGTPDADCRVTVGPDAVDESLGDGAVGVDRVGPAAGDAHGRPLEWDAQNGPGLPNDGESGAVMTVGCQASPMAVTLPAEVLGRYRRFTLYNSPYAAHDHGCAVDLYPGDATHPDPEDGDPVVAPSPVTGEVLETRTVTAPSKPYAAVEDHLILVDTGVGGGRGGGECGDTVTFRTDDGEAPVARILHVNPSVEAGDSVAVGDPLGRLVRAGFFAPWVANHLHLGFRPREADPYRASGSLPLALDPSLRLDAVPWDGTGSVFAAGETYAVLDAPAHPAPGEGFAGLAGTVDVEGEDRTGVLDGGLPHYDGGGLLRVGDDVPGEATAGPAAFLGTRVGRSEGRDVAWDDVAVLANGESVRGVALAPARDELGVKLVGEGIGLEVGTDVTVTIEHSDPV